MFTKGIRGSITIEENSAESIGKATMKLLNEMIRLNNIDVKLISHVIFTLTEDLNAVFPAKVARVNLGWHDVAMMCYHELNVPDSLEKCLRVLIVLNCDEEFQPQFVYLKGAAKLRG